MYRIYIWTQLVFSTNNHNLAHAHYKRLFDRYGSRSLAFETVGE